jgi:hypothetical protein
VRGFLLGKLVPEPQHNHRPLAVRQLLQGLDQPVPVSLSTLLPEKTVINSIDQPPDDRRHNDVRAQSAPSGGGTMNLQVEFDYEGRTYTVESPSINLWNVHMLAQMNDKMTIETDLRTGGQIFVTWSEIGVIRLVSPVDDNGHAAGPEAS